MSPLLLALSLTSPAEASESLCAAVKTSSTSTAPLKRALEAGADPNQQCSYQINHVPPAMMIASVIILPLLPIAILADRPHNPPALSVAILRGRPAYVSLLLEYGADPMMPSGKRAPAPLPLAIGKDLNRGGTRYTGMLLADVEEIPARLMVYSEGLDQLPGNPALFRLLVDKGLDPQGRDEQGQSWMTRALARGDLSTVRFLEAEGVPLGSGEDLLKASLAYTQGTAPLRWVLAQEGLTLDLDRGLTWAAQAEHRAAFARLREAGARFPSDGLGAAVDSGRADWVRLAIEDGALISSDSPESLGERAVRAGSGEVVAVLMAQGVTWTPGTRPQGALESGDLGRVDLALTLGWQPDGVDLALASRQGSPAFVRALMQRGAPVHPEALGAAVSGDNAPVVRLLLEAGGTFPGSALPDVAEARRLDWLRLAVEQGAHLQEADRQRAAELAVAWGDPEAVALLADAGARLPQDWSPTSLLWDGDLERLDLALSLGMELNSYAVDTAVREEDLALVQALLDRGAPPSGWALMRALSEEQQALVQVLLEAGATFPRDALVPLIELGDPELVAQALVQGVDQEGWGGSHGLRPAEAALDASPEIQQMLFEAGVRWHDWDDLERVLDARDPRRLAVALRFGAELEPGEVDRLVAEVQREPGVEMVQEALRSMGPRAGASLALRVYGQAPALAASLSLTPGQRDEALRASLSPSAGPQRAWLLQAGAHYPADCLTQAVVQADLLTVAQVLDSGVRQGAPYGGFEEPVWAAASRGEPALLALLAKHQIRLPPESTLEPWWKMGAPVALLEPLIALGAEPSSQDVALAIHTGSLAVLEVLAEHLHDPTDWRTQRDGEPQANTRVAEIQQDKRKARRAARWAARRSRVGLESRGK